MKYVNEIFRFSYYLSIQYRKKNDSYYYRLKYISKEGPVCNQLMFQ